MIKWYSLMISLIGSDPTSIISQSFCKLDRFKAVEKFLQWWKV